MLRPKHKISRREMKEDALVTTYAQVTSFYERHRRTIQYGVLAAAGLIILAVVLANNRSSGNEKAMTALGKVYPLYDAGQFQQAVDGVPERNIQGLASIVDNYGSTPSGELARFYLAGCYFQLGRYDEALEHFEDCSPEGDFLEASRLAGMGACREARGEHAEAASLFEKASGLDRKAAAAPENLFHAARNLGLAGEKERAIELYTRLKKEYPASVYAREVDRAIAGLSV
ncbi:MAG: tetratricopeptide repeat protein [Bacteroidota bacterium]